MSSPAKAHEPSMEEILASIRRIISDDEPAGTGAAARSAPKPAPQPEPDASEGLGQDDIDAMFAAMDVPAPPPAPKPEPRPEMIAAPRAASSPPPSAMAMEDDLDVLELTDEIDPPSVEPDRPKLEEPLRAPDRRLPAAQERLISPETDESVSNAFGNLAHTILAGNARTLDDIVRDMLRPMLRSWLDDNLPPLVERLVRQEIERVARGGR